MSKRVPAAALLAVVAVLLTLPVARADPPAPTAQSPQSALDAAAAHVLAILRGAPLDPARFTPAMLAAAPPDKWVTIAQQITAADGIPDSIAGIAVTGPGQAIVRLHCARAVQSMRLTIDGAGRIAGLYFTGSEVAGDSFAKVAADMAQLPGASGFALARLDPGGPVLLASRDPERPAALGSAFKLYILAELVAEVNAGERHWSDVVPLTHRSLPSGILQSWPAGTPMTLQSLATLMISISDNSAADTLLFALGRERVEARMRAITPDAAPLNTPFLSTGEMFALKAPALAALSTRYLAAGTEGRRAILTAQASLLNAAHADPVSLTSAPQRIDRLEWFASPRDMVTLLAWLNVHGDAAARAILAVNPGVDAHRWGWLGYKGGSETGVIAMDFIACPRTPGPCYALSGGESNPTGPVSEAGFAALMSRLLNLAAPP